MCNLPRVRIGANQTLTVSELLTLAAFGGKRLFFDLCLWLGLPQPFFPLRAFLRAMLLRCVFGKTDEQRSTHTTCL